MLQFDVLSILKST